jgi:Holliday junction resolvasome RuvABC endonuclease subunit
MSDLEEKDKKYVLSLDLSLSQSGGCIFEENGNPISVFSIPTSQKLTTGERLKIIADKLFEKKDFFNLNAVVLEAGFSRFSISTQQLYKVHGIASYVFYDIEQIYFAPSSIKKIVGGSGKTDKKEIRRIVEEKYSYLDISNEDESDAVSIGMAYFMTKGEK